MEEMLEEKQSTSLQKNTLSLLFFIAVYAF